MTVKIDRKNGIFYLNTRNTTYVLGVYAGRHLVHLYYGK